MLVNQKFTSIPSATHGVAYQSYYKHGTHKGWLKKTGNAVMHHAKMSKLNSSMLEYLCVELGNHTSLWSFEPLIVLTWNVKPKPNETSPTHTHDYTDQKNRESQWRSIMFILAILYAEPLKKILAVWKVNKNKINVFNKKKRWRKALEVLPFYSKALTKLL